MKAIIKKEQLAKEKVLKVLACKHVCSTSLITRYVDIGKKFTNIKSCNKTTTDVNLPHCFGLEDYLGDIFGFKKASGELVLKFPAHKAIIDHCVCCPEKFDEAMTPKITKRRLVENCMVDVKTHLYPDVTMMVKICRSEIKQEHKDLLFNHFSEL